MNMSLVAYGSSDESSEDEDVSEDVRNVKSLINKTRTSLTLPAPKDVDISTNPQSGSKSNEISTITDKPTLFKNLPKPKHAELAPMDEAEDDIILTKSDSKTLLEKAPRKKRAPVKISLPSLAEFKDVEEDQEERKKNRIKPSEKGTGLFSILPPPKGSSTKGTIKSLIPDAVKKALQPPCLIVPREVKNVQVKAPSTLNKATPLAALNYDSESDDDSSNPSVTKQNVEGKMDFFLLSNSRKISPIIGNAPKDFFSLSEERLTISAISSTNNNDNTFEMYRDNRHANISQVFEIIDHKVEDESEGTRFVAKIDHGDRQEGIETSDKTLTSNVMNLAKKEIILKNKAEVGPKLPVPEQEYNVDAQGNVAFDEKAIEYLCGKRGVKRKIKDFDEANIIEINGEDIKPHEREWLVKALTEEPAERPVSMESAGPSTQSRKKHQITYLAHQAKAMEVELKNQWAQNKVTRKQTQSKYGF